MSLAIEALNRFETDLVNTVEQGIELCASIDRPNVGLALDTFHMNIEEKDIGAAIRAAAPLIRNVQVSENDRGACGSGHVPWSTIFDTLDDIGYVGPLVVESFRDDVVEIGPRGVPVAAGGDVHGSTGSRLVGLPSAQRRPRRPALVSPYSGRSRCLSPRSRRDVRRRGDRRRDAGGDGVGQGAAVLALATGLAIAGLTRVTPCRALFGGLSNGGVITVAAHAGDREGHRADRDRHPGHLAAAGHA